MIAWFNILKISVLRSTSPYFCIRPWDSNISCAGDFSRFFLRNFSFLSMLCCLRSSRLLSSWNFSSLYRLDVVPLRTLLLRFLLAFLLTFFSLSGTSSTWRVPWFVGFNLSLRTSFLLDRTTPALLRLLSSARVRDVYLVCPTSFCRMGLSEFLRP